MPIYLDGEVKDAPKQLKLDDLKCIFWCKKIKLNI